MIDLSLSATKRMFFDRKRVIQAVDRATHKNLSKFGAYVRTRAKTSIKYRKTSSSPNMPPSAHRTMMRNKKNRAGVVKTQSVSPLRELIFFAFEQTAGRPNVVIGPIIFKRSHRSASPVKANMPGRRATVPSVLEFGGQSLYSGSKGNSRIVAIAQRPYMRPAFEAEQRKLPSIWANSVKG